MLSSNLWERETIESLFQGKVFPTWCITCTLDTGVSWRARSSVPLVRYIARSAQNPHFIWNMESTSIVVMVLALFAWGWAYPRHLVVRSRSFPGLSTLCWTTDWRTLTAELSAGKQRCDSFSGPFILLGVIAMCFLLLMENDSHIVSLLLWFLCPIPQRRFPS